MFSIIIPYKSSYNNLRTLINLLLLQTTQPREILIFDSSISSDAKKLVRLDRQRNIIKHYYHSGTIYEAWNKGIYHSKYDPIFLNDDVLITLDFLEILVQAKTKYKALSYVPAQKHNIDVKNKNSQLFQIFSNHALNIKKTNTLTGFCFLLPKSTIKKIGYFDTKFNFWFGDLDYNVRLYRYGFEKNCTATYKILSSKIYHYGAQSYSQHDIQIKNQIIKDKIVFDKKYQKNTYLKDLIRSLINDNNSPKFLKDILLS